MIKNNIRFDKLIDSVNIAKFLREIFPDCFYKI